LIDGSQLEDVLAAAPVERLMEDSWESRSRQTSHRELVVEVAATVAFLAVAVPLAAGPLSRGEFKPGLAALLVVLYAVVSRTIKFPIGAGYVVPSYLVLVPMLVLLPPQTAPLLAAAGLVLGTLGRWAAGRASAEQVLFAVPDAWHSVGPAVVLSLAGEVHGIDAAVVYVFAFFAGCVCDLISSTIRESLILAIAPQLQGRVIALVWVVDGCIAPLGLLVAYAARPHPALLLLLLPVNLLLMVMDRDRNARIAEAQHRLGVVARERTRLQAAVHRLGDAFAARLDLHGLTDVLLGGSIDALDADAGRLAISSPNTAPVSEASGDDRLRPLLEQASRAACAYEQPRQLDADGAWALALPLTIKDGSGALAVARRGRAFRDDEKSLMLGLVERAQAAVAEIVAHELLREQAQTDPLTRLGNRRKLATELRDKLHNLTRSSPVVLMLFDLDGFKRYNDTFGHVAGDALLARLGNKLRGAVMPYGDAYRLGGDEFCVLLPAQPDELHESVAAVAGALEEHGETFAISASCGAVLLPHEATTADYALQLADKRMYTHKQGRPCGAREQAHDVLVHIMRAKQPELPEHSSGVAQLAIPVGRRLGMNAEEIDELARAAALHDVGKVGIPDAILEKPGPLDADEWSFVRQHTLLGERILSAAPALRPVATIVRASHERWDGGGYPDGLRGEQIPLAARIVAVCDAFDAMITDRCYRPARSREFAREELRRESGRQFDPVVVTAFLAELDRPGAQPLDDHSKAEHERLRLAADVVSRVRTLLDQAA
jgi:diguanylate cyclase (GGDEF)-like protein